MCAINPVHKKRIIFDVYTSDTKMTKEQFESKVLQTSVETEVWLNSLPMTRLRWHAKETDQQAE